MLHQRPKRQIADGVDCKQAVRMKDRRAVRAAEGKATVGKRAGNVFPVDVRGETEILSGPSDRAVGIDKIESVFRSGP